MPKNSYETNIFDTIKEFLPQIVKVLAVAIFVVVIFQLVSVFTGSGSDLSKGQVWIPSYSPTIGNKDSKLALVYFYDLQCPSCKDNEPKLEQTQEAMKDRVLFVYRNLPLQEIHPYAEMAARSTMAVHRQSPEKFFTYKKELYSRQNELGVDLLETLANNSQIDITQWNKDRNDRSLNDEIKADVKFITDAALPKSSRQEREKPSGISSGTPTNVIVKDGQPVDWWSGSLESSEQIKIIEKYL
jgi:thiol-disulfide isomerase/thioredoxin